MSEPKPAKNTIDWEAVEKHYRADVMSLRAIATEYGLSEGAIRKRAKKDGWERNLGAKIKAKADEMVRKAEVRKPSTQLTPSTEKQVIEANADLQYRIRMEHRGDISRSRALFQKLLSEVEMETDNTALFKLLGELLDESGPDATGTWRKDKLNEIYQKVVSQTGRVDNAKKLIEMLEKLVKMERQAFGVVDDEQEKQDVSVFLVNLGIKVSRQAHDSD